MPGTVLLMAALAGLSGAVSQADVRQIRCLADTVYHEARGEPLSGQAAVANVVLNRAIREGESLCAVVYAPYQFSWIKFAKGKRLEPEAYKRALDVSLDLYLNPQSKLRNRRVTHFHAKSMTGKRLPRWALNLRQEGTIGNHVFYSPKG